MKKLYWCCALLSLGTRAAVQQNSSQGAKRNKGLAVLLDKPITTPGVVERATVKLNQPEVIKPVPVAQIAAKKQADYYQTIKNYWAYVSSYLPNVRLRK